MTKFLKALRRDDKGATAIEYGLIAALIAVAIITVVGGIGDQLGATFTTIETELKNNSNVGE